MHITRTLYCAPIGVLLLLHSKIRTTMQKVVNLLCLLLLAQFAVAQTPIAHYPFSGNANDAIGTNHGTVNGATLTTDRFGNANSAYSFDGTNDIINFANLATTQVDNFTVSAWVKSANLNQWGFIVTNGFDNTISANGWTILQRSTAQVGGATGAYVTGHYPYSSWVDIGQNIGNTNSWYHLTLVRDNGVSKFYLNGISNGQTNSATPISPAGSLAIGGSNPGANYFNGAIDEVKIYNTALTPTQIQQEYTSSVPSLVAHYPFTGNANDISSNANHGTVTGATLTADRFGNANSAYSFNGSGNYIEIPNSASLESHATTQAYTQMCWMKITGMPAGFAPLIAKSNAAGSTFMYRMYADANNLTQTVNGYGISTDRSASFTFSNNVWYQVATTYDGANMKFYVNGNLIGTSAIAVSINANSLPLVLGADFPGSAEYFQGAMDEVKIYNTALSPTQIQQEYTSSAQTLIAHYPFTGNANDAIGTNHGTLNGATLTTDRFGNANSAYSFDGTSNFIETANVATTQTDNYTMSAWIKPSVLPQLGGIVLNGFDNTVNSGNGYSIVIDDGSSISSGNKISAGIDGAGWCGGSTALPATNQWYHVVVVRDNGISKVFINGVQTSMACGTTPITPSGTVRIGAHNGGRYFNGAIDEIKIYNTALTAAQVLSEYNATSPTPAVYSTAFNNNVLMNAGSSTDWIDVPDDNNLDISTNFSLEAWLHPTSNGTGCCGNFGGIIFSKENSFEVARFADGSIQYALSANGAGTDWVWTNTGVTIPLNAWSHISFVKDGNIVQCYLNGILSYTSTTAPAALTANTYGLRIGARVLQDQKFQGRIDDARIWNTARSNSEIVANMNSELTGSERKWRRAKYYGCQ
jgi:hypothetical protein